MLPASNDYKTIQISFTTGESPAEELLSVSLKETVNWLQTLKEEPPYYGVHKEELKILEMSCRLYNS